MANALRHDHKDIIKELRQIESGDLRPLTRATERFNQAIETYWRHNEGLPVDSGGILKDAEIELKRRIQASKHIPKKRGKSK